MEENSTIDNSAGAADEKEMKLCADDKFYLVSTAKWIEFLCIVMFVSIGLVLAGCLISGLAMCFMDDLSTYPLTSGQMGPVMIIYGAIFLIYLFPTVYMYQFARKTKSAIASYNESEMTQAFMNLRAATKFYGIMVITSFALMIILMLIIILRGIAGAM